MQLHRLDQALQTGRSDARRVLIGKHAFFAEHVSQPENGDAHDLEVSSQVIDLGHAGTLPQPLRSAKGCRVMPFDAAPSDEPPRTPARKASVSWPWAGVVWAACIASGVETVTLLCASPPWCGVVVCLTGAVVGIAIALGTEP